MSRASRRLVTLLRRRDSGIVWPELASLAALYLFDDGTGTTLTDYGPNGLHGTLGATTTAPSWVTEGLSFDGGDGVVLPGGGALDLSGNNATCMAVFNISAPASGTGQVLGAHGPNPFNGYAIQTINSLAGMYTNGGINDSSGVDVLNDWVAFIAVLTSGTLTWHINGNSVGSPVAGASITAYTGAKAIGSNAVRSGLWITGKVVAVGVWSTPLGASDLATVYENLQTIMAGRVVTLPDPT